MRISDWSSDVCSSYLECFGPAPFLPMSREEMDQLGWDSCDIIIITGDAYVDHPSFGMAIIGRLLEAQGFRVGIIAQPNWQSKDDFMKLGEPNLFFGVARSEEHTSELQSLMRISYAVFCLKKKIQQIHI